METVIKLENISKQYRLGLVSSKTLRGDISSWYYRMRGKEDPTLKIGEENRLDNQVGEYVWSLRDINLEVKQGEILGIIGKNGAGKSTLLKLLSRVTAPTTGSIKAKGRIASLLEVGTGMHPELTGRENIYLNGAILGMTKAEIKSKLDEIVDFAGIAKYIDTPVKRYSSGMHVRLGFAVAAHLEPEILIVDEVLAVGDAEFQKKAIGKMQDISKGGGRTVLFVSHNMASVQKLCTRAVLLENGKIKFSGSTLDTLREYDQSNKELNDISEVIFDGPLRHSINVTKFLINERNSFEEKIRVLKNDKIEFSLRFTLDKPKDLRAILAIHRNEQRIFNLELDNTKLIDGSYEVNFMYNKKILNNGEYQISIGFLENNETKDWLWGEKIVKFEILEDNPNAVNTGALLMNPEVSSIIKKINEKT